MIRSTEKQGEKKSRPFCQSTGCFDHADVYIVIKETEDADYYKLRKETNYEKTDKHFNEGFDGFKIILYLCSRHDGEFKYLIMGSELRIAKRCDLRAPQIP
jgi:hypothetical protein